MSENGKRSKANARVRKHIPAGGEVLDLLNLVEKIGLRQPKGSDSAAITKLIMDKLDHIAHLMREKALEIHEATRERPPTNPAS